MSAPKACGVCKGKGVLRVGKTLSKSIRRGRVVGCLACDGTGRERSAQEGVAALLAPSPAPADGGAK